MGDHDAPESWLDRWRAAEPVRLYLWTVATAMLAAGGVAGWLTTDLSLALAGVVSALLAVGGASAARREAYAPVTVERLQERWQAETEALLDRQHELSWEQGVESAAIAAEQVARTPEKVAAEVTGEQPAMGGPTTRALAAQAPWREQVPRCDHVQDGLRCVLPRHPATFPHRLEDMEGRE